MSQSYKVNPLFVDNSKVLSRYQTNQYRFAYYYDTSNVLYKQFQRKLYRLGYNCNINGDFSRANMRQAMLNYGKDKYKFFIDFHGITYYSLYSILFDIKIKEEKENLKYNDEPYGNDYDILFLRSDLKKDINKKKLVILNPMDDFGERIIQKLIPTLDYYETNYLVIKQYSEHESLRSRVERIKRIASRRNVNPIVFNIGNAYDYSVDTELPTLLRGVNIYYNRGLIMNDVRKTHSYVNFISKRLSGNLSKELEYVRIEENIKLPILRELNEIPCFQLEIGYTNNPIDRIILNDPDYEAFIVNSLCHAIQRAIEYKKSLRYVDFVENDPRLEKI